MLNAAEVLGEEGPLRPLIPGFRPRPPQQEMATAVETTLAEANVLVCEAGTGIGKTFAYLAPAIASGKKVLVSTGTKNLQEQLYSRDLPLMRDALGGGCRIALLKGRANYLCSFRLGTATQELALGNAEEGDKLARIESWAGRTRHGDIAELLGISEEDPIWRQVTSTVENCLGGDCPLIDQCHVLQARKQAIEADVVVINHHLFFADLALREEGFGELLPSAEAVIFDEAHVLPDIATQFFGFSLGSGQLTELLHDLAEAYGREAGDMPDLPRAVGRMKRAINGLRPSGHISRSRLEWEEYASKPAVSAALDALGKALEMLILPLKILAERGRELAQCHRRAASLLENWRLLQQEEGAGRVRWVELRPRGFSLHQAPLDVAESFSSHMATQHCAWIFTSATLAVGGHFEHFASRLGLQDFREACWESPFDFANQTLCYLPEGMPAPASPDYPQALLDAALPVLRASRGRAFFLFTSYRVLDALAECLRDLLPYPLLVQGSAPRTELLERFRSDGNCILLGTSSFWQGVDVRGEALSCVIIDKLPFAVPDDPLLRARMALIKQQGRSPFMEYQLPQAVIALKQGAGRLIRDWEDHGVLMLCDPRLSGKAYGRAFLDSLPPMPRTRVVDEVVDFFSAMDERAQLEPTG